MLLFFKTSATVLICRSSLTSLESSSGPHELQGEADHGAADWILPEPVFLAEHSNKHSMSSTTSASRSRSQASSQRTSHTTATSLLPALQTKALDENDQLEPLDEEDLDPGSFDLVAAPAAESRQYSLETRSEQLFSTEHLRVIFADPVLLSRFTSFLGIHRQASIPVLIYYLDAVKALRAIGYSNAVLEALDPIPGYDFTAQKATQTANAHLQEKADRAFEVMVRDDLPYYITWVFTQMVSLSIQRRITGTLPVHLREASDGLAEVFCLTDPSRADNPIVFASEGLSIT